MDYQNKIEEYRQILKEVKTGRDAKKHREELHKISTLHYVPMHTNEEYMEWIQENFPKFEKLYTDQNPYYMAMFTVKSQWVYGDSIYECLDKGMSVKPQDIEDQFFVDPEVIKHLKLPSIY